MHHDGPGPVREDTLGKLVGNKDIAGSLVFPLLSLLEKQAGPSESAA